jgi:hypothetical protein
MTVCFPIFPCYRPETRSLRTAPRTKQSKCLFHLILSFLDWAIYRPISGGFAGDSDRSRSHFASLPRDWLAADQGPVSTGTSQTAG